MDLSNAQWRKSTRSGPDGGNCVEVAESISGVLVRDSKDPDGPVLAFDPHVWLAFIGGMAGRA
ncbi:DUF397 domain-containing protein [Micromonospora sp. WMMD714]|uniref:DUF397 domain-containing protein n=1 Tax=Micromonospora sp. WMMD714 TaxID=3016097 RepID=UPI00249C2626|nr:DUF397 domain-containing protein [Micromonospora sp. WMMD714]WFE61821.1 DUF397 domain-containing protein [Micromonospora sp. WMMD714]